MTKQTYKCKVLKGYYAKDGFKKKGTVVILDEVNFKSLSRMGLVKVMGK